VRAAEPSHTAYRVALRRAAHQLLDRPRVLDDPIPLAIIRPEHAEALRTEPERVESGRIAPYLRAFMAVRARFAEDQGIAFDYSITRASMTPRQRLVYDRMAERVRALGEPWQDGFVPEELVADLRALGFAHVEDVTPEEMNARYLAGRADGLQVGTLAHLMWAGAWP